MGRQNLCKGNKVSWAFQANRTKSCAERIGSYCVTGSQAGELRENSVSPVKMWSKARSS